MVAAFRLPRAATREGAAAELPLRTDTFPISPQRRVPRYLVARRSGLRYRYRAYHEPTGPPASPDQRFCAAHGSLGRLTRQLYAMAATRSLAFRLHRSSAERADVEIASLSPVSTRRFAMPTAIAASAGFALTDAACS